MKNPWIHLPRSSPHALKDDLPHLLSFNRSAKSQHRILLNILPEPFLGDPQAAVVLLSLNPGFTGSDVMNHQRRDFRRAILDNLKHRKRRAWPFYLLNPQFRDTGGYTWWSQKLRLLSEEVGAQLVARHVCCLEYFPYHSLKYRKCRQIPVQEYTFELLRSAMRRKALIVVMRSYRIWADAVPELKQYDRLLRLRNPQNPCLTSRNCSGFKQVVRAINRAESGQN